MRNEFLLASVYLARLQNCHSESELLSQKSRIPGEGIKQRDFGCAVQAEIRLLRIGHQAIGNRSGVFSLLAAAPSPSLQQRRPQHPAAGGSHRSTYPVHHPVEIRAALPERPRLQLIGHGSGIPTGFSQHAGMPASGCTAVARPIRRGSLAYGDGFNSPVQHIDLPPQPAAGRASRSWNNLSAQVGHIQARFASSGASRVSIC